MKETKAMKVRKLRTKHAPKPANPKVGIIQGWNTYAPCTGKDMVANLSKVKRTYAEQVKADRRAAALERREAAIAGDNARVADLYN